MTPLTDTHTARIDAWLAGQLTPVELQAFEQERRDNPDLEAHCQYLLHLRQAQDEAQTAEFRSMLLGVQDQLRAEGFLPEKKTPPTPARRAALPYAAALLLLLLIGTFWWLKTQREAAERAQQQLRLRDQASALLLITPAPQAASGGPRMGLVKGSLRDSLAQLLQSGQYPAAEAGWRAEHDKAQEDPEVRFFWAVAQMKAQRTDPQRPPLSLLLHLLDQQAQDPEGFARILSTDDLRWYAALALLADGQADKAKPLLQKISGSAGTRQREAADLLKKM